MRGVLVLFGRVWHITTTTLGQVDDEDFLTVSISNTKQLHLEKQSY